MKRVSSSASSSVPGDSASGKRTKYLCKFQQDWTKKDPMILRSKKSINHASCSLCGTDFSVGPGGWNDVTKHKKTSKHMELLKQSTGQSQVSSYFRDNTRLDDKVIRAETLFSQFVAEHNLPFLVADHFTPLVKKMFPDSRVAEKFSCARTKTTCIIKGALAPAVCQKVVMQCQMQPFTILIDESNDRACDKEVAILVRVWDHDINRVATRFLDMPVCNIPTAENLFASVEEALV